MKLPIQSAILFFALIQSVNAAVEFPVQARLFGGGTAVKPADVNAELESEGLKKFETLTQFGVEMTYPVAKFLDIGLRYTRRHLSQDENPANELTDYSATLNQDSVMGVVRLPFLKSTFVRADAFAGFGGSNTVLKIKTAAQDGELQKKDGGSFLASPVAAYGASVGFGFKNFYIVFEGGMEQNEVKSLKRTGTVNSNIEEIDLSGGYFTVALMFDGVTARKN